MQSVVKTLFTTLKEVAHYIQLGLFLFPISWKKLSRLMLNSSCWSFAINRYNVEIYTFLKHEDDKHFKAPDRGHLFRHYSQLGKDEVMVSFSLVAVFFCINVCYHFICALLPDCVKLYINKYIYMKEIYSFSTTDAFVLLLD